MRSALATLGTAFADGKANRASFVFQIVLMAVNDIAWIVFWGLFFHRVGTANGWTFHDVIVMFSLLTVVAGIGLGLFANCRRIGRMVADSSIDEVLVLPVRPLGQLLCRRVEPTNLGDLVFGVILFLAAADPTPERLLLWTACVLLGVCVMVAFLVWVGSFTFFVGGRGEHADLGFNALLLLASYPLDFFGGPVRVLLFTIVPAAFITGVPVSLMRHFAPGQFALIVAAAAILIALAWSTFHLGLRRYSSGSLWMR